MEISTLIAKHCHGHLVEDNLLVSVSFVLNHVSANSVLLSLAHGLVLHMISQEVIKAGNFVNKCQVVHCERRTLLGML